VLLDNMRPLVVLVDHHHDDCGAIPPTRCIKADVAARLGMLRSRARPVPVVPSSAFKGSRFPPEVIALGMRWYLRFGLSYRDVEEP
jgi:hypothetical protein